MLHKRTKLQRRQMLKERLQQEPLLTDEELARIFAVSIQTVRLDRMALNIPELRERARQLAQQANANLKAMQAGEVVGELLDLELGVGGISILETTPEMAFTRNHIIRGHYIFAQANSLAVALIDAPTALTASANVKFRTPARVGERLIAKATVVDGKDGHYQITVLSKTGERVVFEGNFMIVAVEEK